MYDLQGFFFVGMYGKKTQNLFAATFQSIKKEDLSCLLDTRLLGGISWLGVKCYKDVGAVIKLCKK